LVFLNESRFFIQSIAEGGQHFEKQFGLGETLPPISWIA
jgi:hypothetical protein